MKSFSSLTFDKEMEEAGMPVLVDFWAAWCGPCRMLAPVVEQIAGEYEGRVLVGKVNVDEETGLTMRFGIRSIPTLLLFMNGKPVDKLVGSVPASSIREILDKYM
ncbi:MAG: thioredoxin [Christensenellales bacterium]|jgi:thioredoxin 1